ncbi:hypothetical protein RI367_003486 [Sorochytrium milnesiophthora]
MTTFDYAHPPPYDDITFYQISAAEFMFVSGTAQSALLCFLIHQNHDLSIGRASGLLTVNVLAANTAFCGLEMVLCLFKIYWKSYCLGLLGCWIEGFFVSGITYWALSATMLIALDRYVTIVWERVLLSFQWYYLLGATWAVSVFIAALPFMMGMRPVLQPAQSYCEHNFASQDPADRAFSIFKISVHFFGVAAMVLMYIRIYFKVRRTRRNLRQIMAPALPSSSQLSVSSESPASQQPPIERTAATGKSDDYHARHASGPLSSPTRPSTAALAPKFADDIERATFIRAAAICVVALISWVPYIISLSLAVSGASVYAQYVWDCTAVAFVISRCHGDIALISLLDPVPRQLLHRTVRKLRAIFRLDQR